MTLSLHANGYFARNILSFSAGRIQNEVKSWRTITKDKCCDLLYIPKVAEDIEWPDENLHEAYEKGIARSIELLKAISTVYHIWFHHYIRYKHGLSIALTPYGKDVNEELVNTRKNDDRGYPVAFDCSSISDIVGTPKFNEVITIPDISSDHVRLNALKLSKERNLLRYVLPPLIDGDNPSLSHLVKASYAIGQLQTMAIRNYHDNCDPDLNLEPEWACTLPKGNEYVEIKTIDYDRKCGS